jgi:hypothetical protein
LTHSGPYYAHDLEPLILDVIREWAAEREKFVPLPPTPNSVSTSDDFYRHLAATITNRVRACYALPRTDPLKSRRSVPKRWRPAIQRLPTQARKYPTGTCASCGHKAVQLPYLKPNKGSRRKRECWTCYQKRM